MNKKQLIALKKRLTNKLFLTAIAAAVYQMLQKYGNAPDLGTYQLWVDLVCYAVLGGAIYSSFDTKKSS